MSDSDADSIIRHIPAQKPAPKLSPRPPPLFRLPAELRTQIWRHAYGNQHIIVSLHSLNKPASDSHSNLIYMLASDLPHPFHDRFVRSRIHLPPAVCKQFYSEATAALYVSSTFEFTEPHTFRAFALGPHACVSQIQHLRVPYLEHKWKNSLTSSLVGRLKSLRGVHFTHRSSAAHHISCATHPHWKSFWRIIRAFQQHELEAPSTKFEVVVYTYQNLHPGQWPILRSGDALYEDRVRLQKELTESLLQYIPRRLSRRGVRGN